MQQACRKECSLTMPPRSLVDTEICRTNLTSLPEDLDSKRPNIEYFYLEDAQLSEFPEVLTRMQMTKLSIVGNQ
ncbi:TPA: hypothetical protein N0F65_012612 [Lagenidium giganteum]|uniref:Uncharacterized protein n=1 Tax=Lagenidium giganteum TaxID=4803 RepID=A0AAV2YR40_9STRA|nr:TPA: hypothetical protein N0F65_012612 [Lagenidium giganteum]